MQYSCETASNADKFLFVVGLQKQMLFMRCAYESQVEHLTIFPFPGLKIINIRGQCGINYSSVPPNCQV